MREGHFIFEELVKQTLIAVDQIFLHRGNVFSLVDDLRLPRDNLLHKSSKFFKSFIAFLEIAVPREIVFYIQSFNDFVLIVEGLNCNKQLLNLWGKDLLPLSDQSYKSFAEVKSDIIEHSDSSLSMILSRLIDTLDCSLLFFLLKAVYIATL